MSEGYQMETDICIDTDFLSLVSMVCEPEGGDEKSMIQCASPGLEGMMSLGADMALPVSPSVVTGSPTPPRQPQDPALSGGGDDSSDPAYSETAENNLMSIKHEMSKYSGGSSLHDTSSARPENDYKFSPWASGGRRKRSRPQPDDEEARLIAIETESHLKKLNIDPTSREGKVERRKIQNRMSAQMHRERKRAYIETLEAELRDRDATIAEMKRYIAQLEDKVRIAGGTISNDLSDLEHPGVGTTSESESDAGYSSSASLSCAEPNYKKAPLGISIFSLMFVLTFGFTFMAKPDMMGSLFTPTRPQPGMPESTAYSGHGRILLAAPTTHVDVSKEIEEAIGNTDDDLAALPDVTFTNTAILSGPTEKGKQHPDYYSTIPSFSTENSSLWNFGERVAHLYPGDYQLSMSGEPSRKETRRDVSGALVPTYDLHSPSASLRGSAKKYRGRTVDDRALIAPANSVHRTIHQSNSHSDNIKNNWALSKVLMTEGKALLDPSIVQSSQTVRRSSHFGFSGHSEDVVRVPNVNFGRDSDSHSDLGTALIVPSSYGSLSGQNSHFSHASADTVQALEPTAPPKFLMMLPASSVKWGTSWDDDDSLSNPLTQLLKNMKDNHTGATMSEDLSSYWIEIGCSVLKAQLVRNVTIV